MSLRLASWRARRTRRPMRPNPLIATRSAMTLFSLQCFLRGLRRGFGGDAEMLVDVLVRRGGAERVHADEDAARSDVTVPAFAHAGFDGDLYCRLADHGVTICCVLFLEQR